MGSEFIWDGLTVGYVLALTQFLMTWLLGWLYVRRADRVFDPLATRVLDQAQGRLSAHAEAAPPAPAPMRPPTGEVAPQ
jgi:hypothetical protein